MLNEIAEFKAYTQAPIYKRDNKNDNSFFGRFTREGIQAFEGFPRVLTIIARGYMFKNGNADIEYARRAISAWCSIPDKDNAKEVEKYALMDKKFDNTWRDKVTRMHFSTYYLKTKGAWILRFDDILASALELGELKNKDFELSEETKAKISDFTKAPSTAYALEILIKYYYANRQEDTDWVVLPVANFDAHFGSTSFSKKRLTELVKSGAIERENSYNVSRYRLNEIFEVETIS